MHIIRKKLAQQQLGQSPGALVYTGESQNAPIKVVHFWYDDNSVESESLDHVPAPDTLIKNKTHWFNIEGIHDTDFLKALGESHGIHTLFLEDIANVEQRPSTEYIDPYLFVSLKYLALDSERTLLIRSVNILTDGQNLFSFCESGHAQWLSPIMKRLQNMQNAFRKKGPYYLLYALMDVLVDEYYVVLEQLSDEIETMDKQITLNTSQQQLDELYKLKKNLLSFSKRSGVVTELIRGLEDEMDVERWTAVEIYFEDLLDHSIHVHEVTKSHLDTLSGMFDLYFSLLSLQMNRTIQTLTILTVVFLPLTLLSGIYGMNFKYMPGVETPIAFWIMMGGMLVIVLGVLWWFKRQKWF